VDHPLDEGSKPGADAEQIQADRPTRGFLFADLRDYTKFVATHGATSAADLLIRYRALVRGAIERFRGAEIRTEGDSFYVVFGSVSTAVLCALEIKERAKAASAERPEQPVHVGIGIHAGETIETPDGYVGTPVNIAARICSVAAPGEVLVSDTVRALTQGLLTVRFQSRGRRRLKGVPEPVAVFAVASIPIGDAPRIGGPTSRWSRLGRRRLAAGGIAAAVGLVGLVLIVGRLSAGAGLPPGPWKIGIMLPQSSQFLTSSNYLIQSAQLAVNEANAAGGIGGARIELDVRDTSILGDGPEEAVKSVQQVKALLADPHVVAVIGPWYSTSAKEIIPLTNEAGLLQCGAWNAGAGLTRPEAGAIALRPAHPDRISYVRMPAVENVQARGAATFAINDLAAKTALVIDDTSSAGRSAADEFEQAFTALGGSIIRRALNPGSNPATVLESLDGPGAPTLVFFGGFPSTGAPDVRRAIVASGHAKVEFMSWEGILDYSSLGGSSYIQLAGEAAVGTYASQPSVGPVRADFENRFRAAYGVVPEGPILTYAAASHACTEVILQTLRAVAAERPNAEELRDAVRAYAVDPQHRFQTVVGEVSFDVNGDNTHQFVTIYRAVPSDPRDPVNWAIVKQLDFGSTP
jgi:class 3 adenylate cyclase/ABC-type branched-subunit amino acid transport system substrate-binding protein